MTLNVLHLFLLASVGDGKLRGLTRWRTRSEADLTIFDTILHIPSERRPFVAAASPFTRVVLPLAIRPDARLPLAALIAAAMAAACLALAVLLFIAEGDLPTKIGLTGIFVVASLVPVAVAATAMRDFLRPRPLLVVDREGLRDERLGSETIAWGDVESAEIVGEMETICAVRLSLVHEGKPLYNPFRIGGWSVEWRRRRRDRLIALSMLDRRPHEIAHTIVALSSRHRVSASS